MNELFPPALLQSRSVEIRALAEEMYKQVYAVAPTLFGHCGPACVDGVCTEGKMSCGKAAEVRAHYQTLREGK